MFTVTDSKKSLKEFIEERNSVLSEKLHFYDLPYQEPAIEMFKNHLLAGSSFGVLFDTDVDGIASGKMMVDFLEELEESPKMFINMDKKHGLNDDIVQKIVQSEI